MINIFITLVILFGILYFTVFFADFQWLPVVGSRRNKLKTML